jgi:hypothetical protein
MQAFRAARRGVQANYFASGRDSANCRAGFRSRFVLAAAPRRHVTLIKGLTGLNARRDLREGSGARPDAAEATAKTISAANETQTTPATIRKVRMITLRPFGQASVF